MLLKLCAVVIFGILALGGMMGDFLASAGDFWWHDWADARQWRHDVRDQLREARAEAREQTRDIEQRLREQRALLGEQARERREETRELWRERYWDGDRSWDWDPAF